MVANQQATGYDERFKFTGKERDAETGFDYFGARSYWSLGFWTSVDPLTDKNIESSSYMYCEGNPIKYVDPDGKENIISFNVNRPAKFDSYIQYIEYVKNKKLTEYAKSIDNKSQVIHFWGHGTQQSVKLFDESILQTPQEMYNYLYENSFEFSTNYNYKLPSVLVLHSCSTGAGENSFAQKLSADKLFANTLIIAPSATLDVTDKETIENSGVWRLFYRNNVIGEINGYDTPKFKFWGEQKEAIQLHELFEKMTTEQIFEYFGIEIE